MRMCISCGEPIPTDKRKDARYCGQSKCRGREYRKRHPKPIAVAQPATQTTTVLACPCGRRYLLTVAELHDHAGSSPTQPAQIAVTRTEQRTEHGDPSPQSVGAQALTQTAPQTDPASAGFIEPVPPPAVHELRASTQTVSVMDARPDERARLDGDPERADRHEHQQRADAAGLVAPSPAEVGVALESVTPPQPNPPPLTTLELTFCDASDRPLSFRDAVSRDGEDRWSLRAGARVVLRCDEQAARSLGRTPGRWFRYYARQSPAQFGFDADLVVMFWAHRERRGRAASVRVLQGILGDGWKPKLREIRRQLQAAEQT